MPRAVVMRAYGGPEVLAIEDGPLAPNEIRVRTIAAAVNHSDLEIRAGNRPIQRAQPFPYVPGLEVVGDVVELGGAVADFRIGDRVITMMQGTGGVRAKRDGGYAEYASMPASVAAPVPADLDPLNVAALGLASVTAFEGLRKLGDVRAGRVAVTGASGGVGSAAVCIARAQGAHVVAIVSRAERVGYAHSLGASEVLLASEVENGVLGEASIDGVLDTVAGKLFRPCADALQPDGVLSVVGAVGGGEVTLDAYALLEITLTGYSSESLDGPSLRAAMEKICWWLREGQLKPPSRAVFRLQDAAQAHVALEARGVEGRLLLVP